MSKRDDDSQTDIEVGMTTAERRRRRRRGGGLRVPSDNVPRRTTPPVVAPVPEDPSLAMSIAYSFTSDASEPVPVEIPDQSYSSGASGPYVEPVDDAPEEALPTVIDSVSGPVELADFEVKTREMSAVDLEALGLTEPGANPRVSGEMSTVSDPGLPGVEVRFKRPERAERSQEIEPIEAMNRAAVDTVETDEQTAISAAPSPSEPPATARPQRDRLKTVALSDEDLEEVREAVRSASAPPVVAQPSASTSQPMPARSHTPSLPPLTRTHPPTPPPPIGAAFAATLPAHPHTPPPPPPHAPPAHTPPPPPAASRSAQSAASELWGDKPQRSTVSGTINVPPMPKDASQPMAPFPATPPPPAPSQPLSSPSIPVQPIASQPIPSQPIPVQPSTPARTDASNSTQPLTALDVEKVDDALSAPEIDLQDLADRAESSGEFEVEVEEADEIKAPEAAVTASAAAAAAHPTSGTSGTIVGAIAGTSGEIKRERAQSVPPPIAAPAATPHVGAAPPPAPAAAQVQVQHPWAPPKDHKDHKDHKEHHPPPPPPAAAHHHKPPAPPPAAKSKEARPTASSKLEASGKGARVKPWFVDLFDEDYLRTLPFLTPQATQAEAEFVANAMGLTPGAQVLDIGCGYGRHAMELAARGFHVVGLDISSPLLVRGNEEAQRRGLQINFVRGDMRELDFEGQFDGAYCLFSTFGYFDDETNKKTVANIARSLKPGGRVLIEILNRDYVIADLPTRVWWEGDGCVVLEEVELNYFSSRIQVNRSVVFDDGRQLEQEISVRAYSLHEVGKLMHAAGFRVLEVSGGYQTRGRFFGNQSRHIIVLAERKDAATT